MLACPECQARKLYVNAENGLFKCQKCGIDGNFEKLQNYYSPKSEYADVYEFFYEHSVRLLLKTPEAFDSLLQRGFTEESIGAFGYGYSDERLNNKVVKEFGKEALVEAKLWIVNEEKGYDFPFFDRRVIIPFQKYGRLITMQGRAMDDDQKRRYIFLPGKDPCLYHGEDLNKRGRVWLTEGAFKRDRIKQEGGNAAALSGANQWKKFLADLNACEDLWIVMDNDALNEQGKRPGNDAAKEMSKQLRHCTVVTLPLPEGCDKVGVDDFIEEYGYESLEKLKGVTYEYGVETKPTSLSVLVSSWKDKVESAESKRGYETGHPRLDRLLEGVHDGALYFIAGSPQMCKTTLMEDFAARFYKRYPDVTLDYYTNDDSLYTTLTRWVAKLGRLRAKDCRYPKLAFADDPAMYLRFETAVKKLQSMSDRLQILDRSYNISLETLKVELLEWRKENRLAKKVLFIDAFTKTKTNRDGELKDEMSLAIYKSSLLKEIAQEVEIPVLCTHEVPKLNGKRPNAWNLRGSNTLEYDADVIFLMYQEAHIKGIERTELKVDYQDGEEPNPIIEAIIAKDKVCGTSRITNLFELDKLNAKFKELNDSEYYAMMQKVRESEKSEYGK